MQNHDVQPMKITVVGTGGVGGYFGGRLALAGHHVTFVARGKHLEAINSQGLKVQSIEGDFHIEGARATDALESIPEQDIILFATKTWQLAESAQQLKQAVGKNTLLIPLLNGVDAPEQLQEIFGLENVLGGLCKIISFIDEPGVIKHTGAVPYIEFGELQDVKQGRCQKISAVFSDAGIKNKVSSDITVNMWEKFFFISAMSALGAITESPIGAIRTNTVTRKALSGVMLEIQQLSMAMDIAMHDDIVSKTLHFVDQLPEHSTSSMQRDIAAGKLSEIDAQLGTVVKLGKAYGVSTPVADFIYTSLTMRISASANQ